MTLLSVIVPVYRVQGFLGECLDSILTHERTDIEVIAVDDCSPDGSAAILRRYAARDPRLIVTSTPRNVGLGPARNAGLELARGDWVWFVDSDDTLTPGAIDAVCDRLTADGPDVLFVDYAKTYPAREPEPSQWADLLRRHPPPERFDLATWPHVMEVMNAAWTKIVRRDLLLEHDLTFPPGWYEDIPWTYKLVLVATSMSILDKCCYLYRQRRSGSITATGGPRHFELFDQWARLWQRVDDADANTKALIYHRMVWHYLQVVGNDQRIPARLRREFFLRAASDYHRYGIDVAAIPVGLRERVKRGILRNRRYRLYWTIRALGRLARALLRRTPAPPSRLGGAARLRYALARRLPVDAKLIAYVAQAPSDTPSDLAAVRARLRQTHPAARHVWLHGDATDPAALHALARARHVLCDTDLPAHYRRRAGSRAVRFFPHTPFTPIGLDRTDEADRDEVLRQADALDALVVADTHTAATVERAYQPTSPIHTTGTPTTAALTTPRDPRAAKRRLGLAPDVTVVTHLTGEPATDLDTLTAALRDVTILIGHHADGLARFPALPPAATLDDALAATDVLVTDHASALAPFLLLDRPIVLRPDDVPRFDPPPGPVATTTAELAAAIRVAADAEHRQARYGLRDRLGVTDSPDATDHIIAVLLATEPPRPSPESPAPAESAVVERSKENVLPPVSYPERTYDVLASSDPEPRLRSAVDADAPTVLTWRNHPKVRAASFTTAVISDADHKAWWGRTAADPQRHLYLFTWRGNDVGVVHFDVNGDIATWSHYLDVDTLDRDNELLPAWLELGRTAVRHAFDTWPIRRLDGETMAWNTPVIAMNRRFGADVTHYTTTVDGRDVDVCGLSITTTNRRV